MAKASSRASVRSKKSSKTITPLPHVSEEKLPVIEEPTEERDEFPEITITILNYQHIAPNFPSSYVFSKGQYSDRDLGETKKLLITDDPLIISNHTFKLKWNSESPEEVDRLVTNPIIIKIFQSANTESKVIIQESSKNFFTDRVFSGSVLVIESAISLYEAFTGDVVEGVNATSPSQESKLKPKESKNKKKGKKGSKTSRESVGKAEGGKTQRSDKKSSKGSKKEASKESLKKTKTQSGIELTELEVGACVIDLLPLIFGSSTFSQFLPIIRPQQFYDDRMERYSVKSGLHVKVSIDKPFTHDCKPDLLSLTLESIYNLPSIMNEEMDYQVCVTLPSLNLSCEPVVVKNGSCVEKASEERKLWPGLPRDYTNVTLYNLTNDYEQIKNSVDGVDVAKTCLNSKPRIQFNCIKRNVLLKEGFFAFYDQIKKFRKLVFEIYAKKRVEDADLTKTKRKSNEAVHEGRENIQSDYLHLMAVVDVSSLLYPGVTKVRVAAPLTTFHRQDALEAGLQDSYFFPAPKKLKEEEPQKTASNTKNKKEKDSKSPKGSKKEEKSGKSKDKKSKESKSSKGKDKKDKSEHELDLDMKNKLPPVPQPEPLPEPAIKVYSESGQPTFIIIEIELTRPLVAKKDIEDLENSLSEMMAKQPTTPKAIFGKYVSTEFYYSFIREIVNEINSKYSTYMERKKLCNCEQHCDFITYLKRSGSYQHVVVAMIQIASLLVQFKLKLLEGTDAIKEKHRVMEEIFIQLMSAVNQVLHKTTTTSRVVREMTSQPPDVLLFYAKEAIEMNDCKLAQKYYLERLHHNSENPDFWFDFAVFQLQLDEYDKAFMCLQEALSRKNYHRNSLLLTGILLAEKKRLSEAELCLLTVMAQSPRWVEGWTVLYLFYKEVQNLEGMEFAEEMATKYLNDSRSSEVHNFLKLEDLAWTSAICPNSLHFKTAVMLIKMRMFSWAEHALTSELKETGTLHYLLGVICYYRRKYEHAIEHLARARHFHGSDYAVVSLTGHCFLALGEEKLALKEYLHVLQSFERPNDMHLLYLNGAKVVEDVQECRKLLLLACKNHPTPYTWMCCGVAYYKLNDLVSAEECFSESVRLDNSNAESWGYLALINLKLKRSNEAEVCCGLALKNDLNNTPLLEQIETEFAKIEN